MPSGLSDRIPGSLRRRLHQWRRTGAASKTALRWISSGVLLPLRLYPPIFQIPNHLLKPEFTIFIDQEVSRLLAMGAISETNSTKVFCSPLGVVPKKNGKLRLITDMRVLNTYLATPKFRYEGLQHLAQMLEPGDWHTTIDLKDGFFHAQVHPRHRHLLGFRWRGRTYTYNVFPFGLQSSPWVFSRLVAVVVKILRARGHRVLAYVDDIILLERSQEACKRLTRETLELLLSLGWHINWEKSSLVPSQSSTFLGLLVDTSGTPMFKVPPRKKHDLIHDVSRLIAHSKKPIPVRRVAAVVGHCTSLSAAIVPTNLMLRNLHQVIRHRKNWNSSVFLSDAAIQDLRWWKSALRSWDGKMVAPRDPDLILETDASLSGWGGLVLGANLQAAGHWGPRLRKRHINELELRAVLLTIQALSEHLQGKAVRVHSDNSTTVAYINKFGGRFAHLNTVRRNIFRTCTELSIELSAAHVPGVTNVSADTLSRTSLQQEWGLKPRAFQALQKRWGPYSFDRMASSSNKKVELFNSRFRQPGSAGADALAQSWVGHNNYVCPPLALVGPCLRLVASQQATATIILPMWKRQWWFPLLKKLLVDSPVELCVDDFDVRHCGNAIPEPLKRAAWRWLACKISGAPTPTDGQPQQGRCWGELL